jgi:pyrroloquinoline quinone (PQQ) biosynthesis protein C
VVRTHLKSPQLRAFLFALAPPEVADNLAHNLLEELGIKEDSCIAHPSRLKQLAVGAGLAQRLPELEALAASDIRQLIVDPLQDGALKEVGLVALCKITAFEFMLAGVAGRIARALATHYGLSPVTLEWFTYHSEVDMQHAEQGLDNLVAYIRYYEFREADALAIMEMTLRENVFIKRYFDIQSCVRAAEVESGGQLQRPAAHSTFPSPNLLSTVPQIELL